MKLLIVFAALISVACAGWLGHRKQDEGIFGPSQTSTNIVGAQSSSDVMGIPISGKSLFHPKDPFLDFPDTKRKSLFHPKDEFLDFPDTKRKSLFHPKDEFLDFPDTKRKSLLHPKDPFLDFPDTKRKSLLHPKDPFLDFPDTKRRSLLHPKDEFLDFPKTRGLFGSPQTSTNIVGYTSSSSPLNLS